MIIWVLKIFFVQFFCVFLPHLLNILRNRFKGLDLIDRVPDGLWNEVVTLYRRQGSTPSPWKRNAKKQNGCLRRPYNSCEKKKSEKQRRKGKTYPFECRVLKNSKER